MSGTFHFFTVDVEDWPQSTLCHNLPISRRVVANTHALLELLDNARVKGTFFVLGKVALAHPDLTRTIAREGHEIGTHGFSHESVQAMSIARFREELYRSVEVLRQQSGQPVLGHRAADFSISTRSLHLLDELTKVGLTYDSSLFPIKHPRYGVPNAWRHPHHIRCTSGQMLLEFPLATVSIGKTILPGAGGGYLRLFPYWWTRYTVWKLDQEGIPATCYMHPYELDVNEMHEIPHKAPFRVKLSQGANRGSVKAKLKRLLSEFSFMTMSAACEKLKTGALRIGLDLGQSPPTYVNPIRGQALLNDRQTQGSNYCPPRPQQSSRTWFL